MFEAPGPEMHTFGVLGLSCETPAAPKPSSLLVVSHVRLGIVAYGRVYGNEKRNDQREETCEENEKKNDPPTPPEMEARLSVPEGRGAKGPRRVQGPPRCRV